MPDRSLLETLYDSGALRDSRIYWVVSGDVHDVNLRTFAQMFDISDRFHESGESVLPDLSLRDYLQADLDFHKIIIAAASNRYMTKILDDARLLVRVFIATSWKYDQQKLNEANRFHERLLAAMRGRDGEAACRATVEAMRVARENAIKAWERQRQHELSEH